MKHAGVMALAGITAHLAKIRKRPGLVERKPGIFYRKGQAFLHFHEDPAGMFADLRANGEWLRLPANSKAEWAGLLTALDRAIS